jgi:hypothetical protein
MPRAWRATTPCGRPKVVQLGQGRLHQSVVATSPVGHTLSRAVPVKIDLRQDAANLACRRRVSTPSQTPPSRPGQPKLMRSIGKSVRSLGTRRRRFGRDRVSPPVALKLDRSCQGDPHVRPARAQRKSPAHQPLCVLGLRGAIRSDFQGLREDRPTSAPEGFVRMRWGILNGGAGKKSQARHARPVTTGA